MLEYTEKVIREFMSPKNMGKIENADGIGKVGNPVCGDVMWMYICFDYLTWYPGVVLDEG